jgi:nucleotide-binding universal stress UspA family protein
MSGRERWACHARSRCLAGGTVGMLGVPMGPLDELALIAYDGSGPAQHAVMRASRLLSTRHVLMVTVWEERMAFVATPTGLGVGGVVPIDPTVVAEIEDAAQRHAERVAREGAQLAQTLGLDAEPLALAGLGGVGETLIDVAHDRSPAVIVIGTRGLGGLRARLEGSTARYLLKHAKWPLLAVYPEPDER